MFAKSIYKTQRDHIHTYRTLFVFKKVGISGGGGMANALKFDFPPHQIKKSTQVKKNIVDVIFFRTFAPDLHPLCLSVKTQTQPCKLAFFGF